MVLGHKSLFLVCSRAYRILAGRTRKQTNVRTKKASAFLKSRHVETRLMCGQFSNGLFLLIIQAAVHRRPLYLPVDLLGERLFRARARNMDSG